MPDLTERLRRRADGQAPISGASYGRRDAELDRDAAREIERLRGLLRAGAGDPYRPDADQLIRTGHLFRSTA